VGEDIVSHNVLEEHIFESALDSTNNNSTNMQVLEKDKLDTSEEHIFESASEFDFLQFSRWVTASKRKNGLFQMILEETEPLWMVQFPLILTSNGTQVQCPSSLCGVCSCQVMTEGEILEENKPAVDLVCPSTHSKSDDQPVCLPPILTFSA
jgi:hypothetical protein